MGSEILLLLLGSVALLLWGVRMVRTGMLRAHGTLLRRALGAAARKRLKAFLGGIAGAFALQSSTAVAVIIGAFAGQGLVSTSAALAVMLGADLGTSFAAQLLALDVKWLWSVLLAAGVPLFLTAQTDQRKGTARLAIGLGLILLALTQMDHAIALLRDSPVMAMILQTLAAEKLLAFLLGAVLTVMLHSSLAFVMLTLSLAGSGLVGPELAVALVLGANAGGAIAPVLSLAHSSAAARRAAWGHLAIRGGTAVILIPFAWYLGEALHAVFSSPAVLVAMAHTGFNLCGSFVGLPLIDPIGRLLERLIPDAELSADSGAPRHLDPAVLDNPAEALACATRETIGLGERVSAMLAESWAAIETGDPLRIKAVEHADDAVDRLHEAIKLYIVQASRAEMNGEESARAVEILGFVMNLEHVGDILDKSLMELAEKRGKLGLSFSPQGLTELRAFHARIMETMRLSLNVFTTRDMGLARRLFADKSGLRAAERDAAQLHFSRLREGVAESLETSAIHLDMIRDLKRIHGHLTSVAYPILEAAGELAESRLREREAGLRPPGRDPGVAPARA
ncbi:Na/Pi cotransporter family protein [Roseococcus sp. SYP-B2431]|uniref:Na/Pi cotransporter family protein n=1 Tax=Roseococcus sp. SYP-B2431 TaxID=2496640 RepID=UPI00103CDF76|nr:Na/Pi cotransporter family protein [Roseococcus sp. SYP-B2431]TCI00470.1 Na/Pi cotransporter family protein [Roseococcus sp. SYP-B2431]